MKAIVGVWDDRGLSVFLDRLRTSGGFDVVPAGRAVGVKEIEGSGLVVMNLRPFTGAVEDIDIGGTALLRAAAKRFAAVAVVVDPDDYPWVAAALTGGGLSVDQRRMLAHKAFQHVSAYDASVAASLRGDEDPSDPTLGPDLVIGLRRLQSLRYGENPHQKSAFYQELPAQGGVIATAKQLHGKDLSHNNIIDADAAWSVARDFEEQTFAIVKHTNPCGLASRGDQAEAYRLAFAGDPVSAFGGIVACNRELTLAAAEEMRKIFFEIVIAPSFQTDALALLRKKRDLRILEITGGADGPPPLDYRRVSGGMLVQTPDDLAENPKKWRAVTRRAPSSDELAELAFAWRAVKHVKSNAIVLTKERALRGMGAGQPNRVTSVNLALRAAGGEAKGCVAASDAFFPFADGVEAAAEGGVTAIVQPGGSIRDEEVIADADAAGLAMVFTGARHFKH